MTITLRILQSFVLAVGMIVITVVAAASDPSVRPRWNHNAVDGRSWPTPPTAPATPEEEGGSDEDMGRIRPLTEPEINRTRFMELRGMRLDTDRPDRVTVRIPAKAVDEFMAEMVGLPDFPQGDEEAKREFRRLTAALKLHYMAMHKDKALPLLDQIQITSDPEVFSVFRRHVIPTVLRGCATNGCHVSGSGDDVRFEFLTDVRKSPESLYADFIALCELDVDGRPLIDREKPGESLLLTYLLPPKDVKREFRHPGTAEITPIFRDRRATGYRRIERWIDSLKNPPEDYGVHLLRPPRPTSLPAEGDEAQKLREQP